MHVVISNRPTLSLPNYPHVVARMETLPCGVPAIRGVRFYETEESALAACAILNAGEA